MRIIMDPPILPVIYGISTEIFQRFPDFTKDFKISTEISGFRERFQISREISGKVYEISVSGGPLDTAFIWKASCYIPKCALFSIILLALFSPSVIVVQLKICDIIERKVVVESSDVLFNNKSSWLSDVALLQLKPKVFG